MNCIYKVADKIDWLIILEFEETSEVFASGWGLDKGTHVLINRNEEKEKAQIGYRNSMKSEFWKKK